MRDMPDKSQNLGKEAQKHIESVSAILDDLERLIEKNKLTTDKRVAELNAKVENIRKAIERRRQSASASRSQDASPGKTS